MKYIVKQRLLANGTFYEKGTTFPDNLSEVDYQELLEKEIVSIIEEKKIPPKTTSTSTKTTKTKEDIKENAS